MVYRHGVAVNRNAWWAGPDRFVRALEEKDLPDGRPIKVVVQDEDVLIVRQGSALYAVANTCAHEGGPLCEGKLEGDQITCPWHGSQFRLTDGRVLHGPASSPLPRYNIRVREGQIEVRRAA
jgi:nitrite reductase/ring-hydroxylating ferredoxin subunit